MVLAKVSRKCVMKNKVIRNIITIVLLCVTVITLMSFCACQKDDDFDTQPSGERQWYEIISQYALRLDTKARIIYNDRWDWNWENSHKIEMVNSLSQLEEFNILGTSYTEEYFENRVVFLIPFWYASSDNNIEFIDFAIKDDKFYPIFATNSPIGNEKKTDDIRRNLYVVEVDYRVLDYEFEEILVINRRDVNYGSTRYKGITSVFE